MTKLRIVDRKDKLIIEVDGGEIPYVVGYELFRKPSNTVLLNLALAMSDVEIEIDSENDVITDKMKG